MITGRQLGDEKVRLLCESLKLNHKTTTLDLRGRKSKTVNGICHPVDPNFTKIGAVCIGEMLQMNSTLTELVIESFSLLTFIMIFSFSKQPNWG